MRTLKKTMRLDHDTWRQVNEAAKWVEELVGEAVEGVDDEKART